MSSRIVDPDECARVGVVGVIATVAVVEPWWTASFHTLATDPRRTLPLPDGGSLPVQFMSRTRISPVVPRTSIETRYVPVAGTSNSSCPVSPEVATTSSPVSALWT